MLKPGTDYVFTEGLTVCETVDVSLDSAIGGFHTFCANVSIPGHPLSVFRAGDPLPSSIWNANHRAKCGNNAGMVYDRKRDLWVDIYLYADPNRTIINKSLDDYEKIAAELGKRLSTDKEFSSLAKGSNEKTNIEGSKHHSTTGGHKDTQGRRMVSNIGCEDCAGLIWQWLSDNDPDNGDSKLLAGGSWSHSSSCGSRCRDASGARWNTSTSLGARFVSEPLYSKTKSPAQ